ncbi:hypothetical protein BHM03_00002780 [Ensete ventricosum]|nr:hypothetical protein BHM03_00002780 [Ensete ventricosum]
MNEELSENLVERSVSYNEHRPRKPPPDLPSLLLHGRIVYIGMPVSVGLETEGFAIYDAMMQLKNEVSVFPLSCFPL